MNNLSKINRKPIFTLKYHSCAGTMPAWHIITPRLDTKIASKERTEQFSSNFAALSLHFSQTQAIQEIFVY
jgi:hypothetical protein